MDRSISIDKIRIRIKNKVQIKLMITQFAISQVKKLITQNKIKIERTILKRRNFMGRANSDTKLQNVLKILLNLEPNFLEIFLSVQKWVTLYLAALQWLVICVNNRDIFFRLCPTKTNNDGNQKKSFGRREQFQVCDRPGEVFKNCPTCKLLRMSRQGNA